MSRYPIQAQKSRERARGLRSYAHADHIGITDVATRLWLLRALAGQDIV